MGFSVVSGQSVDSGLNEDQSELGILVFSIFFQMFSDGNGLLYQVIKILRDLRGTSLNDKIL